MNSLYVAIGGAVGSVARYWLGGWVQARLGAQFPFGMLAVNVVGSFLLALVMFVALRTESISPGARLTLSTGLLGGFTTYSTFDYETLRLAEEGGWALGVLNLVATVGEYLAAGAFGWACGKIHSRRRSSSAVASGRWRDQEGAAAALRSRGSTGRDVCHPRPAPAGGCWVAGLRSPYIRYPALAA
jgi:CrcB protein